MKKNFGKKKFSEKNKKIKKIFFEKNKKKWKNLFFHEKGKVIPLYLDNAPQKWSLGVCHPELRRVHRPMEEVECRPWICVAARGFGPPYVGSWSSPSSRRPFVSEFVPWLALWCTPHLCRKKNKTTFNFWNSNEKFPDEPKNKTYIRKIFTYTKTY